MKKIELLFLLIFVICICGCSHIDNTNVIDTIGDRDNNTFVSEEHAISIVKSLLDEQYDSSIVCEVDHISTIEDNEYYFIHAYCIGTQPVDIETGNVSMMFTIGWYYVDKSTGEVYIENTDKQMNQVLVPYRKIGDGSESSPETAE